MYKFSLEIKKVFISLIIGLVFIFSFLQFFTRPAHAASGINRFINFQGKLVNNPSATNVSNTSYTVVFTIYDNPSGGTALWTETQTVTTADGIFRVALGSVNPIPSNFNFNWSNLYLGIKVNSDAEMTPRVQLAAVPYAFNAQQVAGLTVQDTAGNASTSGILQVANGKTVKFADAFTTAGAVTLGSNTDNITFNTNGATTLTLPTSGTVCTTVSCLASDPFWNHNLGALFPNNSTEDLLIGGQSTTSALFSYTGIQSSGHQTIASVSGSLIIMPNNGYGGNITAAGSIVGVGVNSGAGLLQGTGGITLTGIANINTTGSSNTSIGNSSGSFQLTSTGLNITTGGAITGASSIALGTTPAAAGVLRIPNATYITARNAVNSGDINLVQVNASNLVAFGANLAAFTLGGAITGNSQNITGLGTINGLAITADTGTITTGIWNGTAITYQYGGTGFNSYTQGDLIYASAANTLSKLSITGSSGQCLTSNGTVPSWGSCGSSTGVNWWNELAGALSPVNINDDLLIGGQSTTSALFSYTGIQSSGHQTIASVSGSLIIMPNNGYGGNVGIGTTTPKDNLTLGNGTSESSLGLMSSLTNGLFFSTYQNTAYLSINRRSSDGSFVNTGYGAASIGFASTTSGGYFDFNTANTPNTNPSFAMRINSDGNIGIGTQTPKAKLDVNGTASVAGSFTFANGTGTIQASQNSGLTIGGNTTGQITISPSNGTGIVTVGTATNGLTFDIANGGPTYNGTAQPVKKITLSPEYAGATLTAFNGLSTETNITGSMTSDTDTATDANNYYSWVATSGTQQFYVVAVRVTLPQDFSSWPASNAVVINYVTQSTTGTNSSVQARIYNDSRTSVYAGSAVASSVAGTWTSTSIGSASLTNWNTAGATAVIYLDMGSASSNYSRIGDIVLTYNSKF